MKKSFGLMFILILFSVNALLAAEDKNSIQIKGSDTMVNLGQAWAEGFMQAHPNALIAVTGGGSGTGISALLSNTCDIAATSREMKTEEIAKAKANGIMPKAFDVAKDGLAVVVHPKNPVNQLTVDQLADIYTGKIKNWKDVGGDDKRIVLLSREVNSGTHVYFKEHILRKGNAKGPEEFDQGALLMPSSQAIADEITSNTSVIGYYGMGYINSSQKVLNISKDPQSPAFAPTMENVLNGKYYISRPLILYTNGEPQGLIKEFIDFAFSPEGQKIVKETDFVPLK